MENTDIIILTAMIILIIIVISMYISLGRNSTAGFRAINAISDYNREAIRNGTYDMGMYDKALVPYGCRKTGNIFTKPDNMLAIREEYKELLKPYFE